MSKFNLAKGFAYEVRSALISYHRERLEASENLANVMEKQGLKGREYVRQRVLASRHARRIVKLQQEF